MGGARVGLFTRSPACSPLRQKGDTTTHFPRMHHNKKAAFPGDGSLFCTGSLTQVGVCAPYLAGKSREKAKKWFVFSIGKSFAQGVGKKCRSSGMRLAYYVI